MFATLRRWPPSLPRAGLIIGLIGVYLIAALYPFDWEPPINAATWLPGGAWLFPHLGLARTLDAPEWVSKVKRSQRLSMHVRARPASLNQRGPARIMTLSRDTRHRNFTIGQEGDKLVLRLRTPASDLNGQPEVHVPGVFVAHEWVDLHIFIAPGALRIDVDGKTRVRETLPETPFANWNPNYRLALGNELTTDRPWRGVIKQATVRMGPQSVSYTSPDQLIAPPIFWLVEPRPALVPFANMDTRDTLVNILGFVPLGLLLGAAARARDPRFPWRALLFIAGVSAGLEVLQLGFAERTTAVNDLIFNTLGGGIGLGVRRRISITKHLPL